MYAFALRNTTVNHIRGCVVKILYPTLPHFQSKMAIVWDRSIGVNRPAFGGTVPHFHQMSRGPAKSADDPHFSKMVLLFVPLPIRPYSTCLPRNATK